MLSGILDWQSGLPINRVAYFRDLTGSGGAFGDGFVGNYQRFFGVRRNAERLPASFTANVSLAYELPVGPSSVSLRADAFNLFNRLNVSGFPTGLGGGGSATQVGRPGDPVTLTSAGAPRQVQFSATWRF